MTNTTESKTDRIRALNDAFRRTFVGGAVMITQGVEAMPLDQRRSLLQKVRTFDAFSQDNNPHGEHDFGSIDEAGVRCSFKIDYYVPIAGPDQVQAASDRDAVACDTHFSHPAPTAPAIFGTASPMHDAGEPHKAAPTRPNRQTLGRGGPIERRAETALALNFDQMAAGRQPRKTSFPRRTPPQGGFDRTRAHVHPSHKELGQFCQKTC